MSIIQHRRQYNLIKIKYLGARAFSGQLYRPEKSLPKMVKFYGIKELPGDAASQRKDAARILLRGPR